MSKEDKDQLLSDLARSVIEGRPEDSSRLSEEALNSGIDPMEVIEEGLSKGLQVVGEKFGTAELFLPDLIMAAEAMKAGFSVVDPVLRRSHKESRVLGKVVLGTVAGDLHDIGKHIVGALMTANRFDVHDLGVDVSTERFVDAVKKLKPDILGLSALLTFTLSEQRKVIQALKTAGLRDEVIVMVGGASVTQAWAQEIGADGYAVDAVEAAALAETLVKRRGR